LYRCRRRWRRGRTEPQDNQLTREDSLSRRQQPEGYYIYLCAAASPAGDHRSDWRYAAIINAVAIGIYLWRYAAKFRGGRGCLGVTLVRCRSRIGKKEGGRSNDTYGKSIRFLIAASCSLNGGRSETFAIDRTSLQRICIHDESSNGVDCEGNRESAYITSPPGLHLHLPAARLAAAAACRCRTG